ncbi:MAG TPA: transposase [Salinimicrobium catena]|uniref:Transposase n=1 Tax=Salinimicrobium catena TaxID=390640 RepID=A0A7C2M2I3_9FLAO|nr:transposase [Salinimicrobium catena]
MAERYKNKYRIESIRLKGWDYRWSGAYFITICTAHRKHYFGEIRKGKMEFSPIGAIADVLWHEIPHRTSHVHLGNFVVMPNHIHGILIIDNPKENDPEGKDQEGKHEDEKDNDSSGNHLKNAQPLHATAPLNILGPEKDHHMAKISPKANSISTIIRSYKSATSKHAHRLGFEFEWQTRFHDRIIRNEMAYEFISEYILNNPRNWKEDNLH